MNKIAKILCLVLALLMASTAALAVESSQIVGTAVITPHDYGARGLTQLPITDEPITIQVWKGLNEPVMTSWDQCIVYDELEKRTGIHIDWVYPPVGSERDNFNLRIASNDLPHMFVEGRSQYQGSLDEICDDEVFMDITPYYEAGYTPNYKYLRDTYEDIRMDTILDSGKLAVFWQFDYVGTSPWSGFWARKDLMDKYNLEAPVTFEDWENFIKTCYDEGGYKILIQAGANGGGGGDLDTCYYVFSAYDVGYYYYQVDGTVKYGAMEDGYADALAVLAKWYANGWIDPDFAGYDWNTYKARIADPANYSIFGMNYGEVGQTVTTARLSVPEYDLIPINGPKLTADQELHLRQYDFTTRAQWDALTWRCVDDGIAEKVCQWKDYWYSQEGAELFSYGVEGISYIWNDKGELEWVYDKPENAQYFPIDMADETNDFWTVYPLFKLHNGGYLRDSGSYIMSDYVWACIDEWAKVEPSYGIPMTSFTAEEATDYAALNTPIESYLNECVGKIITGQMDISEWPTVQQNLKDMGIEDCIAYQQAAYDRYAERG